MKENFLKRTEELIFQVVENYQKWEGKYHQMRQKQLEMATGIDTELMVFFLKMKVVSIVPEKWRMDVQKVLFS